MGSTSMSPGDRATIDRGGNYDGAPVGAVRLRARLRPYRQTAPPSLLVVSAPEVFERSSAQLRVSGGVLDVGMPQPKLQPPGVMAGISQEMSASVTQHVRVQLG